MSDEVQWVLWNFLRTTHASESEPDFDQLLAQLSERETLEPASVEAWPDPALVAFRNVVTDFLEDIHEAELSGSGAYCDRKFFRDGMLNNLSGPILTEIRERAGGSEKVLPIRKCS
ncbi:hypothetical protein [Chachezhania sediminis]|uniref:hypothetical protein n=1 Tax=Chachezhania sediminis TaxID=2599291 RepID=UPI00131D4E22|nr:hypothetical protein [Chachezhania sediminis]